MKYVTAIALALLLGLSVNPAAAQSGGAPNMTPEQAEAMAGQMMLRFGNQMGLDPEALRNASPEEREDMLRSGSGAMARQPLQRMEQMFGMPVEEMQNLSDEDKEALRARMMTRFQTAAQQPETDTFPLRYAPARGFPDGSIPLPVAADYSTVLLVSEPVNWELLLVVADVARQMIIWRKTRIAPFEEHLNLLDIAPDPSVLILELIDPDTHRVIRRYRPVAAAE
jgi:hypothetical protein